MDELIGEFIAFAAAVLFFKFLKVNFKILALHAAVAFFVELIGYLMRKNGHTINTWVFNYFLVCDCGLQLLAAYYFRLNIPYYYFIAGFIIFLAVWVAEIWYNGINFFAINAYTIDSILLSFFYLLIFIHTAKIHQGNLLASPAFWLCTSILLFYACNMPNLSLLNYLSANKEKKVISVVLIILLQLIQIRYVLLAIAFGLNYQRRKQIKSIVHANR